MYLSEKCIHSKEIFNGSVIKVRVDNVELENGSKSLREVVHHNGGVCILPLTDDNEIIFVRQFRYPYMEPVLEIPAGKLEIGEEHYSAGKRELLEETGCICRDYKYLGQLYPSPGYLDEIIHLYLARNLEYQEQHLDEDEFLDIIKIPMEKAVEMIINGEIKDSKTQVCILKTYIMLKKNKGSL